MPKAARQAYQCQQCGATAAKWAGQCADCGAWNSLIEIAVPAGAKSGRGGSRGGAAEVRSLEAIAPAETPRIASGIAEFDRVMGGGLVPGSVVLVGGDPGIGKSTLLLQVASQLTESGCRCLYASGEESAEQIALRARRLGAENALRLLTETDVDAVVAAARREAPRVLIADSIQTLFTADLDSAPGGVAQVRESAARLVHYAKQAGVVVFLVGHVTKEGTLAGPRVLEHMVDTVLHFDGDGGGRFRLIRALKNRFGAINELGVFAMTDAGLREVSNPSAIFLSRIRSDVPGSVVIVTREGTRPLLVEVQALVDGSPLANPRRVAVGLDQNRLAMLLAVLHRHGGISSFDQDVFVNVVGGVRIGETAADLAVLLAISSSLRGKALPHDMVVFGELGLAGEVRPVPNGPERLREAAKHGFKRAIAPKGNVPREPIGELRVTAVTSLNEALQALGD